MDQPFTNILLRMPRFIGDCIMATATITDIRKRFPKAKLTLMITKTLAPIFEKDPQVDDLLIYAKPKGPKRRQQKKAIIESIKEKKFDCGILLTNSFSSAFWFWQAGIQARVGFAKDGRKLLLTHPIAPLPSWQSYHFVDQYKMVLKGIGIKRSRSLPRIYLANEEKAKAQELLRSFGVGENDLLVGINATAATSKAKWWTVQGFVEVSKLLEKEGIRLIFFGDESATPRVGEICQELGDHVINVSGKTDIKGLIALIDRCDLLLSGDSGPMHIAAAVKTKVVALFGATSELLSGPYTNLTTIINKHVSCSPCFLASCPIDHKCMRQIGSAEVFEKMMEWLKRSEKYRKHHVGV